MGLKPNKSIHRYMDAYSRRMAWGHREKRHDYDAVRRIARRYGADAGLEAALHVACDMGLVTTADVRTCQELLK